MSGKKSSFEMYLKRAIDRALQDAKTKADKGELTWIRKLATRGVRQNWMDLTPQLFLNKFLWCVGSIQKKWYVHLKHFPDQVKLFKQCDAREIVRAGTAIRAKWSTNKCDLNGRMFEAVMETALDISKGWHAFRSEYLLLPKNPETERTEDWLPAYSALDRLPMVGDAIAWYLIRNLYGAPFFKPDLHIRAIEQHFFGSGDLGEMSARVRQLWPKVCRDSRIARVHLGVVDHVLWWYRKSTGDPPDK